MLFPFTSCMHINIHIAKGTLLIEQFDYVGSRILCKFFGWTNCFFFFSAIKKTIKFSLRMLYACERLGKIIKYIILLCRNYLVSMTFVHIYVLYCLVFFLAHYLLILLVFRNMCILFIYIYIYFLVQLLQLKHFG